MIDAILYIIYVLLAFSVVLVVWSMVHQWMTSDK